MDRGKKLPVPFAAEVKFKIVEDLGPHIALDLEFHMAKVQFNNGQTRLASFEEQDFRRLKRPGKRMKAVINGKVFATETEIIPHLKPHPDHMHLSTTLYRSYESGKPFDTYTSDAEKYPQEYARRKASGPSLPRRIIHAIRTAILG